MLNALDVIKYTLEGLNPSDPSVSISETALRVAIRNCDNAVPFTRFLLQANQSMRISDDTILWTVLNANREIGPNVEVIGFPLRHDPIVRTFDRSDVKEALELELGFIKVVMLLLEYSPELNVDQESFTKAIKYPLIGNIQSDVSDPNCA